MRRTALFLFVCLATIFGFSSPPARAAEDPEQMIREGILARKRNDNETAARLFQRAYQLTKSPRAAAHLGMAEFTLVRWMDAEAHLSEALRARNDPWIENHRADIKRALDDVRGQLGWLEVVGRPEGAEVEVAGKTVGRLPLQQPIRLEAGEVHLRVSAEGYEGLRRSVVVPNGQSTRVVVDLDRAATGSGVASRSRGGIDGRAAPPPPIGDPTLVVAGSNDWRWPAAWVSAGAATLLVGAGIAGALVHDSKVNEFSTMKDANGGYRCSTNYPENGGGRCSGLLAEANQAKAIAIGAFVGAGLTAVLATVFFATAPSGPEQVAQLPAGLLACAPELGAGIQGATCRLRF